MGQYTELLIKAQIKSDAPLEVMSILDFLFNGEDKPDPLPNHPFFKLERWSMIGRCSSYYHVPWVSSRYSEDYLFSRSDLKNYDGEIEAFLEWIDPWLDEESGDCIGWVCHEQGTPWLLFKR